MSDRPHILVVDDHPDGRLLLTEVLRLRGHDVAAVGSGAHAIEHVGAQPTDLVILDLQMPLMDGFATLAALREISAGIPVIALSAHVLPDDVQRMRAAGFDAALSKPVGLGVLIDTITAALRPATEITSHSGQDTAPTSADTEEPDDAP